MQRTTGILFKLSPLEICHAQWETFHPFSRVFTYFLSFKNVASFTILHSCKFCMLTFETPSDYCHLLSQKASNGRGRLLSTGLQHFIIVRPKYSMSGKPSLTFTLHTEKKTSGKEGIASPNVCPAEMDQQGYHQIVKEEETHRLTHIRGLCAPKAKKIAPSSYQNC